MVKDIHTVSWEFSHQNDVFYSNLAMVDYYKQNSKRMCLIEPKTLPKSAEFTLQIHLTLCFIVLETSYLHSGIGLPNTSEYLPLNTNFFPT